MNITAGSSTLLWVVLSILPSGSWAFSTTTPKTKISPPKSSPTTTSPLSLGGADMTAFRRGFVAGTKDFEPTLLDMKDLPSDFPIGTYYKNGPGGYESQDGVTYMHQFDCHGKVLAVTLDPTQKQALFRYKYVETPYWKEDQKAGKMTQRGFFGTNLPGGFWANLGKGLDPKNVANTNLILNDSKDKLFALWEGGRPFELDPQTLETRGGERFLGFLNDQMTFSAHPTYDPTNKSYINFCCSKPDSSGNSEVTFMEMDGTTFEPKTLGMSLEVPGLIATHDMCFSETYIVINWNEARISMPNLFKAIIGKQAPFSLLEMIPQDIARYILIPRELLLTGETNLDLFDDPRVKVVDTPFHVAIHFSNAFDMDNGNVAFEATCFIGDVAMDYGVDAMASTGKPLWEAFDYDGTAPTSLQRFEINPQTGKLIQMKSIAGESIDFVKVPRHLLTKQHKYVYALGAHHKDQQASLSPFGSIRKINVETGDQDCFSFEPYEFVQDPDVARKVVRDDDNDDKEDAVYIVTVVTNGRDLTTDLVILDGENVSAGPVSRLRLPEMIPNGGIHGNFFEGATLP